MIKKHPVSVKLTEENKTALKKYQGMWQSQAGIRISQSDAINLAMHYFMLADHIWKEEETVHNQIKG